MTRKIDADALKEAIAEFHQKENERLHNPLWGSIGLNALNKLIDNAPTVPLPDFKEGYRQAVVDGKTNFSKPQGEWIKVTPESRGYAEFFKCSNCSGCIHTSYFMRECEFDYCPNCGADMREADND